MKAKLVLLSVAAATLVLLAPNVVRAQDASDAFTQYGNPHAICDFYRSGQADITTPNGTARPVIERESDSECLISIGSGQYKNFTQYYYSGNDWCYKLYSGSEVVSNLCVPRPGKSINLTSINLEGNEPYIAGGVVIFVFIIIVSAIGAHKPPVGPTQPAAESVPAYTPPQSVKGTVRKPQKRGRIWSETSRWPKSRGKK